MHVKRFGLACDGVGLGVETLVGTVPGRSIRVIHRRGR